MRFDRIIDAVANGEVDAGLIIHESRFTYRDAGLISIVDLGEWWENMTLLPIPLGAIFVRNDIGDGAKCRRSNAAIRRSLAFARENEDAVMPYVREHAVEMSDDVMRAHIELYVNEFTDDLGETGATPSTRSCARAHDAGILHKETRAGLRCDGSSASFSPAAPRSRSRRRARASAEPLPPARIELGDEVFLRAIVARSRRTDGRRDRQSKRRHVAARIDRRRDPPSRRVSASRRSMRPSTAFAAIAAPARRSRRTSIRATQTAGLQPLRRIASPERGDARRRRRLCSSTSKTSARAPTPTSRRWRTRCRARAQYDKEFWVLDRPNPIGGTIVEGPVLEPAYESFIGLYPIPMRHGMTVGELATLFNDHFGIGAKLRVVQDERLAALDDLARYRPAVGARRRRTFPTWQTTFVYVGTGLLDSAGINNGSGFTKPFFLAGRSASTERSSPRA